jgi:hypothetical protein
MAQETHTIYVHAKEAGTIASPGDALRAGAQIVHDEGMPMTFAHAMVVSNVSGTVTAAVTVPAAGVSWVSVSIDVQE